jgi:hypothetical protein
VDSGFGLRPTEAITFPIDESSNLCQRRMNCRDLAPDLLGDEG